MKEFNNIKKHRLATGQTIKEVAKASGVPANKLGAIEGRRLPVDYETLQRLSAYYGCSIKELI